MIAIDATWFFGGNTQRGIGYFLQYYFASYCPIPAKERLFVVPANAADRHINRLLKNFGGSTFKLDQSLSKPRQRELLQREFDRRFVTAVLIPSPFERPWSMLDYLDLFIQMQLETRAVVFDLLPAQFPDQILNHWPVSDQKVYRNRLQLLGKVDSFEAISPATQKALISLLNQLRPDQSALTKNVSIPNFALSPDWIELPADFASRWWSSLRSSDIALTISGGEWRKNLAGTLEYYSKHLASKCGYLMVVCDLSTLEKLRLSWLAWRLGIAGQVIWWGRVSEVMKWRLLHQANYFLFLSFAEGLGIPLLEARKAKVPHILMSSCLVVQELDKLVPEREVVEVACQTHTGELK